MDVKKFLFAVNGSILFIYLSLFSLRFENINRELCSSTFVAFIVPYRNRSDQLPQFLQEIHAHLNNDGNHEKHYQIYIIEQDDSNKFNRGKLLNIGAVYALNQLSKKCGPFKSQTNLCLIFHDVDMIPLNSQIPYDCSKSPMLLATAAEQFGYKLMYPEYLGGSVAFSWSHFSQINGYPNRYWGWGGEDDDFFKRVKSKNLTINYLDSTIGRFKSLKHNPTEENHDRWHHLQFTKSLNGLDGLNSLNFSINKKLEERRYTHILVDLLYSSDHFNELVKHNLA